MRSKRADPKVKGTDQRHVERQSVDAVSRNPEFRLEDLLETSARRILGSTRKACLLFRKEIKFEQTRATDCQESQQAGRKGRWHPLDTDRTARGRRMVRLP